MVLSTQARQLASSAGASLSQLVASALSHINTLLPGQPTTIVVDTSNPSSLIPQAGVNGFTSPATGEISLQSGRTAQSSLPRTLDLWFPRDLGRVS